MKKHPDRKMSLREAAMKHYDQSDLTRNSRNGVRHKLNLWEKLTDNPPVCEITNETLEKFRQACIDRGLAPTTVNTTWTYLRTIFRRIGPKFTGNPQGKGIIDDVPWMKLVKCRVKLPKRIDLEDIARVYVASRNMLYPRGGIEPAAFWRTFVVVAYCAGLRRGDIFRLRREDIDLENCSMRFYAGKTGKGADEWPLHPVVVAHLRQIVRPAEGRIFRGMVSNGSGAFSKRWHTLLQHAGIERDDPRYFTPHDLRRTGGSEIDRVSKGMGWVFTQHAPRSVFEKSYGNCMQELREALDKMRLPSGFRAGPKVTARKVEEARKARMRQEDFAPLVPNPADWKFQPGAFCFRGTWFPMRSASHLAILELLSSATGPVPLADIVKAAGRSNEHRAKFSIWKLRTRLRECLALGNFDPVPCIQAGKDQTAYVLYIPPEVCNGWTDTDAPQPQRKPRRRRLKHSPKEWSFKLSSACYCGTWFHVPLTVAGRMLVCLAESESPVSRAELTAAGGANPRALHNHLKQLRQLLRKELSLPESINPVPSIGDDRWTLAIPPQSRRRAS